MVLPDTSVWIDHLRKGEAALSTLLQHGGALVHPFVIGELAIGSLRKRDDFLYDLQRLPMSAVALDDEVLKMIDRWRLFGVGIGYIDAHLLAATALTPGSLLWTRDKRLRTVASDLGLHANLG